MSEYTRPGTRNHAVLVLALTAVVVVVPSSMRLDSDSTPAGLGVFSWSIFFDSWTSYSLADRFTQILTVIASRRDLE